MDFVLFICFCKRQLQNYKLKNKIVSGCEFHRFFTFHSVTYSGFSTVCNIEDTFVGLDVSVDSQLFFQQFCSKSSHQKANVIC